MSRYAFRCPACGGSVYADLDICENPHSMAVTFRCCVCGCSTEVYADVVLLDAINEMQDKSEAVEE